MINSFTGAMMVIEEDFTITKVINLAYSYVFTINKTKMTTAVIIGLQSKLTFFHLYIGINSFNVDRVHVGLTNSSSEFVPFLFP